MNLTEGARVKALGLIISPSEILPSGWKGYAFTATILAVGFGSCIFLYRKKDSRRRGDGTKWVPPDVHNAAAHENLFDLLPKDDAKHEFSRLYNQDTCPICLGVQTISVKASCGHSLCADCLMSYLNFRIAQAPLPCPLCRAPLDSVALDYDLMIINGSLDVMPAITTTTGIATKFTTTNMDINDVADWIREYNLHYGLMAAEKEMRTSGSNDNTSMAIANATSTAGRFIKRVLFVMNILVPLLIVGLIVSKFKILPWTDDWSTFGSFVDVALGIALMTCAWFKYQDQN